MIKSYKDFEYGKIFFRVQNCNIFKYKFIAIEKEYDKFAFFLKTYGNHSILESCHVDYFNVSCFDSLAKAKNYLKTIMFEKFYTYREYKRNSIEKTNINSFVDDDFIYLIYPDYYDVKYGRVISLKYRKNYNEFGLDYTEKYLYFILHYNSVCEKVDYVINCSETLFFKDENTAKSKLYEILCKKFSNEYQLDFEGYEFKEEEIIWIIKDNSIEMKIMKKDEKYNGKGFFFRHHAEEYLLCELNKIKDKIKEK